MLIIKEKTVLNLLCKQFSENAENLLRYFTFFIAGPKTILRCNEMWNEFWGDKWNGLTCAPQIASGQQYGRGAGFIDWLFYQPGKYGKQNIVINITTCNNVRFRALFYVAMYL